MSRIDGKLKFWWQFESGTRAVAAPFFGTEPGTVVGILRGDLSGFDQARAMRMVSAFEKDRASSDVRRHEAWLPAPPRFQAMVRATRLVFSSIVALLAGCVSAPSATVNPAADVVTLTAQADRWDKAIVVKDRAAIEANMAEDFRQIDGAGNIENKASFVQGLLDPELKIDPYVVEELDVRLYGDVALLSGRTKMTGAYSGKPFTSHYRYIDVYVRRSEGWKIVSVQISKLPQ